jgi:hypothetical protein
MANKTSDLGRMITGSVIGLSAIIGVVTWAINHRVKENSVKDSYVMPRNALMSVEDLDKDGKYESTFNYGNQKYLMRYNPGTNRVSLVPVEVKTQILEEQVADANQEGK